MNEVLKEEIEDSLFNNLDYLKWLVKFINEYPIFSDDYFLLFRNKGSELDCNNAENLYLLYYEIAKYAKEFNIEPFYLDDNIVYKIRIDNIGFLIGNLDGKGRIFFCNRVEIDNVLEFINFEDIIKFKDNLRLVKRQ